jgi:hypothetical protein
MMSADALADLIALFTIKKKQKLRQHCRTITITKSDFADLIWRAKLGNLPWSHCAYCRQFVPEHLRLSEKDLAALGSTGVGPLQPEAETAFNKIREMFDDRRLLSGHMFFNANLSDWHFFYFDQRDFAEKGNRWVGGSHIQFINRLWPKRTAQSVWKEFCSGNPQMRDGLHIRFKR